MTITGICLSRTETQALCLKAARGKGMSWGVAEEAGFAAGWLIAHGIDGAGLLLRYLTSVSDGAFDDRCPMPQGRYWQAMPNRLLCPIGLGAALLDRARLANGPFSAPLCTGGVSHPILLAPFLAEASRHFASAILLKWGSHSAAFAQGRPCDKVRFNLPAITAGALELTRAQDDFHLAPPSFDCMVAPDTIAALEAYAMQTAVPATETSRRGAGSDSADDD